MNVTDPLHQAQAHSSRRAVPAGTLNALLGNDTFPEDPYLAFKALQAEGLDHLPFPGKGETLERWRALSAIGRRDLGLAKLYEGHTDALAILAELASTERPAAGLWGVWAAEAPAARLYFEAIKGQDVILHGRKAWCSGASFLDFALVTAWDADHKSYLLEVDLHQAGVTPTDENWHALGMGGVASGDVMFDGARAHVVGTAGTYVARPGFWQGGAGVAACWYGAATALAEILCRRASEAPEPHRQAHLGGVDVQLAQAAALLRDTARWIDLHPADDAQIPALRLRAAIEQTATLVIEHAGRALGAAPYCRDRRFAQHVADLPVFIRQTHAEKDLAEIGTYVARTGGEWLL